MSTAALLTSVILLVSGSSSSSSRHRSLSPPAPLVCAAQPPRFVAVAWNPTCECTGGETVRRGGMPCGACYDFAKSRTQPTNYAGRNR